MKNKTLVILISIVLVGLVLRTYQYSELLRFGKDQARDAAIMQGVVERGDPLPLLGPKAGGTEFQMGPIFYYFQYVSAKLFGFSPVTIAFPDLLFSVLTLPVLFLFLRKFLSSKVSLALTGLYAVSFFAVQNGRFAWNPNSLPLFCLLFLYSFLELADHQQKRRIFWAVICGVAIGVGVQLHTLFIIVAGMTFVVFSAYFLWKKQVSLKIMGIVIAVAIVLNIPQLVFEARTGAQNSRSFFSGIGEKSMESLERKFPFPKNVFLTFFWHSQASELFLTGSGNDTNSDFLELSTDLSRNKNGLEGMIKYAPDIFQLSFWGVFFLSGYVVLIIFIRKEKDGRKKLFLILTLFYVTAAFLIFISLSQVLILRYFLILQFVPFLFLGLIFKFLEERYGKKVFWIFLAAVFVLVGMNLSKVYEEFSLFASGDGDVGIAIWSEEKFLGDFILTHSRPGQPVYMVFEPLSIHKFIRPLDYFSDGITFSAVAYDSDPAAGPDAAYFTVIFDEKNDRSSFKKRLDKSKRYEVSDSASFGRFKIMKLELLEQQS